MTQLFFSLKVTEALCTTAAALTLAAASCQGANGGPGSGPVAVETIVQVSILGQSGEQRQEVIRDDAAWRTAWSEIREGSSLPEEPPAVDFGREMVILAAMETQGFVARVTIDSVTPGGGERAGHRNHRGARPQLRLHHLGAADPHRPRAEAGRKAALRLTQGQTSCGP